MSDFLYLPPEQWLAIGSLVLIAASVAALRWLRQIDKACHLPEVKR